MRVLLKRDLFAGGTLYRHANGAVELPDDFDLPKDALIWDGKNYVGIDRRDKIDFSTLNKAAEKEVEANKPQPVKANVLDQAGATADEKLLAAKRAVAADEAKKAAEDKANDLAAVNEQERLAREAKDHAEPKPKGAQEPTPQVQKPVVKK